MHMWFRVRIDSLGKLGLCVVNCSERQKDLDPRIWKVDDDPCAFPNVQSLAANNFPCCELGRLHEVLERKVWSGVSSVCTMSTYPLLMEETNSLFCQPSWLWTMVWERKKNLCSNQFLSKEFWNSALKINWFSVGIVSPSHKNWWHWLWGPNSVCLELSTLVVVLPTILMGPWLRVVVVSSSWQGEILGVNDWHTWDWLFASWNFVGDTYINLGHKFYTWNHQMFWD
jgi:hypothetical protein